MRPGLRWGVVGVESCWQDGAAAGTKSNGEFWRGELCREAVMMLRRGRIYSNAAQKLPVDLMRCGSQDTAHGPSALYFFTICTIHFCLPLPFSQPRPPTQIIASSRFKSTLLATPMCVSRLILPTYKTVSTRAPSWRLPMTWRRPKRWDNPIFASKPWET